VTPRDSNYDSLHHDLRCLNLLHLRHCVSIALKCLLIARRFRSLELTLRVTVPLFWSYAAHQEKHRHTDQNSHSSGCCWKAYTMDPTKANIPPMKDLTIDNITENTIRINSQSPDPRLTYVLERLVTHLHDFARETRLSTKEWMAGLEFLTAVGQICSDVRQVRMHYIFEGAISGHN